MAPPEIGSEIMVGLVGRVTRYNDDNSVNVKVNQGRGRPHKIPFKRVFDIDRTVSVPAPVFEIDDPTPVEERAEVVAQVAAGSSPPEEPQRGPEEQAECAAVASPQVNRSWLGWASITAGGAVVVGVLHGVGAKLVDVVWPYVHAWFPFLA